MVLQEINEQNKRSKTVTKEEALKANLELLHSWDTKSDTFAIRHGKTILGVCSALSSIYINNHFRLKLKLLTYGRASTYLPITVFPTILSTGGHFGMILPDILLQSTCPICTEIRACALQTFCGVIMPLIMAPLSTMPLAMQYNTYNIPYITKQPRKAFQLFMKLTKPISNALLYIFIGQAVMASIVTYFEVKSVETVYNKLTRQHEN